MGLWLDGHGCPLPAASGQGSAGTPSVLQSVNVLFLDGSCLGDLPGTNVGLMVWIASGKHMRMRVHARPELLGSSSLPP